MVVAAVVAWTWGDLVGQPVWLVGWGAVGFSALAVEAVYRRQKPVEGVVRVLVVAALLRLISIFIAPTLSTDIYRYAWDGQVALSGANPYLSAPNSSQFESLRSPLWQQLDHRDVPTVYPPVALASFMVAAAGPVPLTTLKVLFGLTDLVTVWLLIGILRRRAIDPGWAVFYAWNPLVVLETAGMGHVDSLGVMLVVASVSAIDRRKPRIAGLAAAGAVLTKAVPILILPLLWQRRWWVSAAARTRFWTLAFAVVGTIGFVWFWLLAGVPPGWLRFGVSWEFNGPLFEPLWRVLEAWSAPAMVAAVLDQLKEFTGRHDFWNLFYPWNYPQFLAKGILALGLAAWLVGAWRAATLEAGLRKVFFGLLVFSATVYPWYLLWVLPWAVATRRLSYLALSALALISYLPQIYGQSVFPWYWGLMWGGFALAWVLENRLRRVNDQAASHPS